MYKYKVSAGALQYVLLISVVVLVFILMFLMLTNFFTQKKQLSFLFKEAASYNLEHTLESVKSPEDKKIKFRTYGVEGNTSVKTRDWGAFKILISNTTLKNQFFSRAALLGSARLNLDTALYLSDNYHSLTVVGDTEIIGNAHLPILGLKEGSVKGETSSKNLFIQEGELYRSSKTLPVPQLNIALGGQVYDTPQIYKYSNHHNSFYNNPITFKGDSVLKLENIVLKGAVVIEAAKRIEVFHSATLKDVILKAPEIIIHNNVKGNFQCFATRELRIDEGVNLEFPSALVCKYSNTDNFSTNMNHKLLLASDSKVSGIVFYDEFPSKIDQNIDVFIDKNALIKGEVYCNGSLQHNGKIYGKAVVDRFIYKKNNSVYMNMLCNAVIDVTKLPKEYLGLNYSDSTEKGIVKWLY